MAQEYEQLLLKNQLCFPMYACSRKIVGSYTPYLKPLGAGERECGTAWRYPAA